MKKYIMPCILWLAWALPSHSQSLISDFESWNGNSPLGWVTTNSLMALGNPQSVFKSTNAKSGSFATEINTIRVTNKIPGFSIPDYTGSIFTGIQAGFSTVFGYPFDLRPEKLTFWYQYNARNSDSAVVLTYLCRWNTTTMKRDTIAYKDGIIKDSVGVYTLFELPLTYFDSTTSPDTAVVLIASSTSHSLNAGARLLLDDVNFTGGTVGTAEVFQEPSYSLFPNPLKGENLQIRSHSNSLLGYELYTITGQLIRHGIVSSGGQESIETRELPAGMYLLGINEKGKTGTYKIMVE